MPQSVGLSGGRDYCVTWGDRDGKTPTNRKVVHFWNTLPELYNSGSVTDGGAWWWRRWSGTRCSSEHISAKNRRLLRVSWNIIWSINPSPIAVSIRIICDLPQYMTHPRGRDDSSPMSGLG